LVTISFVGSRYHGFQIQKNAVTVQEVFQDALKRVLGGLPDIKGCSRTDAGVHAKEYCISFHTPSGIEEEKLIGALNYYLPKDIRALDVREVPKDFHARYSCAAKRYRYLVYNAAVMDPFLEGYALQFIPHIDHERLDAAAKRFVGKRDFLPFSGRRDGAHDTVRTVFDFGVTREKDLVTLLVTADGFLFNMARIMTGTLLNVARGALTEKDIDDAFLTKKRMVKSFTAPAEGLYLDRVYYEQPEGR